MARRTSDERRDPSDLHLDPDELLPDDLWRPHRWKSRFEPPLRPRPVIAVAIIALVVVSNVSANELLPDWAYIPANLAFAGLLVLLARAAGISWDMLGMRPDRWRSGLGVGLVVFAIIAVGVVVGVALPISRDFFADDRFRDAGVGALVYESLIRIPIGTAFSEEVVFRAVLFAVFLRRSSVVMAATWSSLLFGLWHVLPAFDTFETNPAGDALDSVPEVVGAIAGGVVFTGITGFGFTWLRLRGNSLLAPVLAHTATNSLGYLAGWLVVTNGWA